MPPATRHWECRSIPAIELTARLPSRCLCLWQNLPIQLSISLSNLITGLPCLLAPTIDPPWSRWILWRKARFYAEPPGGSRRIAATRRPAHNRSWWKASTLPFLCWWQLFPFCFLGGRPFFSGPSLAGCNYWRLQSVRPLVPATMNTGGAVLEQKHSQRFPRSLVYQLFSHCPCRDRRARRMERDGITAAIRQGVGKIWSGPVDQRPGPLKAEQDERLTSLRQQTEHKRAGPCPIEVMSVTDMDVCRTPGELKPCRIISVSCRSGSL